MCHCIVVYCKHYSHPLKQRSRFTNVNYVHLSNHKTIQYRFYVSREMNLLIYTHNLELQVMLLEPFKILTSSQVYKTHTCSELPQKCTHQYFWKPKIYTKMIKIRLQCLKFTWINFLKLFLDYVHKEGMR